jgi:hypothetical protein
VPLWPAAKMMDMVVGVDVHAMAPGVPIHPYFGPIYLWHTPSFPRSNVFVHAMPAIGVFAHIPQGIPSPTTVPNTPYWKRYLTNVGMGATLMGLTTFANIAIAAIASLVPKPDWASSFVRDVTGIDTTDAGTTMTTMQASIGALTQWQTWAKLLMPPLPYPGAQGSSAIGSPNVQVNGGPLGFVAPLVATSCSDIPVVPNAMTIGFSNVMVGVTFAELARALAVNVAQGALGEGLKAGVNKATKRGQGKQSCGCGS